MESKNNPETNPSEEKRVVKLPRKPRDNSLNKLLQPNQPRIQRLRSGSGTRAQLENSFAKQQDDEDEPSDPMEQQPAQNIRLAKKNQKTDAGSPSKTKRLKSPINEKLIGQNQSPKYQPNKIPQKSAKPSEGMNRAISPVPTEDDQFKISRTDNEGLKKAFYRFTSRFATEIDQHFKNYNRFIKESKNKIDVQVKASKKEKQVYMQFLNREEIEFWSQFPRNSKFYHDHLRELKKILETPQASQDRSRSKHAKDNEVRNLDMAIMTALDFLPFAHKKFCQMYRIDESRLFTDEQWRNGSAENSGVSRLIGDHEGSGEGQNAGRISTFDSLTQSLQMFDAQENRNWQILAMTATQLVSDTVALFLNQQSKLVAEEDRKDHLPRIEVKNEVLRALVAYCKLFASLKLQQEEDFEEITIVDMMTDQVQFTWANQIYPSLSTLGRAHFDYCAKFLQQALMNDHKKCKQDELDIFVQEIYFCRYLVIAPIDIKMADKVLSLLEKFLQLLQSESTNDEFKLGLLASLKYLVENLCFHQSDINKHQNIVPSKGIKFEPQAMQIQWDRVSKIYTTAEHLSKKENFREHAFLLMSTILKVSSQDFIEQKMAGFLQQIKFNTFFQNKKTYAFELKITNALYVAGPIHLQRYKGWKPKTYEQKSLMIDNAASKILAPIVDHVRDLDHVCLARKECIPTLQQNLLPSGLGQPNISQKYLIQSLPDYFKMIFNPKICLATKSAQDDQITQGQWQFLEQVAFDDLDFITFQGIEFLLEQRWAEGGFKLVNLGLQLADYIINPTKQFKKKYLQLHGGIHSVKGMRIGQQIKNIRNTVCQTMKHIFKSKLHLNSDFMAQSLIFFKDTETKLLCNDQISVIWNRVNFDLLLAEPSLISKELKSKGIGKFHLQERQRVITFEDLNEIEREDFSNDLSSTYENSFMNALQQDINRYIGPSQWDQKKEKFIRHRLMCYLSQVASDIASKQSSSSAQAKKSVEQPVPRQNTTLFYEIQKGHAQTMKLLQQMIKMIFYLPEMHEFFMYMPTENIMRQQNTLDKQVLPIHFVSEENEEEKQINDGGEEGHSLKQANQQSISDQVQNSTSPRLAEVSTLLPYLICCLDFKVSQKTMKTLQKIMIYGDLTIKISLVDQMIYFIKELMMDAPEHHLIAQYLQCLTNMVKIWHQQETTKLQLIGDHDIRSGYKLEGYLVFDLVSAGGESLPASAAPDAAINMYRALHRHLKIFDLLDMLSLIAISNKDSFVRSLGTILSVETGKLKRLLVHKDKQRYILSDLLYHFRVKLQDSLVQKLSVFYCFKGQEFKPVDYFRQLLDKVQFSQFIVDNFEYSKVGLQESLVRDIQVLYMGELTRLWKDNLLEKSRVGGVILNFVQELASRTLQAYETKVEGLGDTAQSGVKDSVGFNLLLAFVLSNVTRSHNSKNRILSSENASGENSDEQEEAFSVGRLTKNTLQDETPHLVNLLENNFDHMHKIPFGSFYPVRIWTSNILFSFLFYLQSPLDQQSLDNLYEIFDLKRLSLVDQKSKQTKAFYAENCLIFYTLLVRPYEQFAIYTMNQMEERSQPREPSTVKRLSNSEQLDISSQVEDFKVSKNFKEMIKIMDKMDSFQLVNDELRKKHTILSVNLANAICMSLRELRSRTNNMIDSRDYLSPERQLELLHKTWDLHAVCNKSEDLSWLCPQIKQIWFSILTFEAIFDVSGTNKLTMKTQTQAKPLDLKFLINLEQEGFGGALRYYKYFNQYSEDAAPGQPGKVSSTQETQRVNEIKLLIQYIYSFYGQQNKIKTTTFPLGGVAEAPQAGLNPNLQDVSIYSHFEEPFKVKKNIYFSCLVNQVVDTDQLAKDLECLSQQPNDGQQFKTVYRTLVNALFKQSSKILLEKKVEKFCKYNLHSKLFVVSLFIGLNTTDKKFLEKSRVLCLSVLPLMFQSVDYRKTVEEKLIAHAQTGQIKQLVTFESRQFYQFIKRQFMAEEKYNMDNHFEKYFSLSGFLRDILNEIIKLQNEDDKATDGPSLSPKMLLKVLDIITYFFSGNLDLRRAPHQHTFDYESNAEEPTYGKRVAPQQESSSDHFIFANLIDYKSFEFLSKLYKVSEKLVDHDNEMLIMNMWYKIVENRQHNFEILAKFLIHNLSSFIMKLRANSETTSRASSAQYQQSESYGIEYEKQKRYSLSIFNYIKARTQQVDIRNSLAVSNVSWSQRMIKLVVRAQLNLHSKYTLEKEKLKLILSNLHAEINQSGLRLQLKGGLQTLNQMIQHDHEDPTVHRPAPNFDPRMSVSMSQLLQSTTFAQTFGSHNHKEQSTIKQLLFIIQRQMSEKFDHWTPDSQLVQMPELIVKYFENTLIMIANEAERLQMIRYTLREEMTVAILILLLMADLACQNQVENARYYFTWDLFDKLAINISGIQKFLRLNALSMDAFTSFTKEQDLLAVFNYRNAQEVFGMFTNLYFKVLLNTVAVPRLHRFMLNFWLLVFEKVQAIKDKTEATFHIRESTAQGLLKPLYNRKQVKVMLEGCFFTLHQISIKTLRKRDKDSKSGIALYDPEKDIKLLWQNFSTQVSCVLEYISPANFKMQTMKDFYDVHAAEISFATNAAFWLSYLCLETCAIAFSEQSVHDSVRFDQTISSGVNPQLSASDLNRLQNMQELGMSAMRRILEESDFLKQLIGKQKLSTHFYGYSLSLKAGKTALLPLLFSALQNPKSCLDAYKSLIVTIKFQDSKLLSGERDDIEQSSRDELQRFLLLVPFFLQQFLGRLVQLSSSNQARQSTTLFSSNKSIIQLLKKSLLSITIAEKKDILNILDSIQAQSDTEDTKVIHDQFQSLVKATVDCCLVLGFKEVVLRSLVIFKEICSNSKVIAEAKGRDEKVNPVIEIDIMEQAIETVETTLDANQVLERQTTQFVDAAIDLYSGQTNKLLLGEEISLVKKEIRPVYFGLKNIILKEIEVFDKDINVHRFFVEEDTAGLTAASNPHNLRANTGVDSHFDARSQVTQDDQAFTPTPQSMRLSKKVLNKKQEMTSKYQNSKNAMSEITSSPGTVSKHSKKIGLVSEFSQPQFIPTVSGAGTNFSQQHHVLHSATQEITNSQIPQTFSDHVPYSGNTPQTSQRPSGASVSTNKNLQPLKSAPPYPVQPFSKPEDQHNTSKANVSRIEMDDEERKQQQEQLSQILFEDDDSDNTPKGNMAKAQPVNEEAKMEQALQEARVGGNSFAEHVMAEQQRESQNLNMSHEGNQEIEGLIGTFAKPASKTLRDVPSLNLQSDMGQQKHQTMKGEVRVQDHEMSYAISSIEANPLHREAPTETARREAALIPGYVNNRVEEMVSDENAVSSRDKFGTGDFPEKAALKDLSKPQSAIPSGQYVGMNKNDYNFGGDGPSVGTQWVDRQSMQDSGDGRQKLQDQQHMQYRKTQQFTAVRDDLAEDIQDNIVQQQINQKTATGAIANKSLQDPSNQLFSQRSPNKAAKFLKSHQTEDLPTPKKSQSLDIQLIEIINDEDRFYELERFLSEEKSYDVDNLAFYVKVMEFQKETNQLNSTLAAGLIIDNYLSEDASYYIGSAINNDGIVARLIKEYEANVIQQQPVSKQLFSEITKQIRFQLRPFLEQFQQYENEQSQTSKYQ